MATLRDDLIPVVDDTRQLIDDLGFRPYKVLTRTRTWSGGQLGKGTAVDVDVQIAPTPQVAAVENVGVNVPIRRVFDAPGNYESGDRVISRISATYTRDQLEGGTLAAGVEFMWLLDDGDTRTEYLVVGAAEKRPLEWGVLLRRRNRKATASP